MGRGVIINGGSRSSVWRSVSGSLTRSSVDVPAGGADPPPQSYHGATGFAGGASISSMSGSDRNTTLDLAAAAHMRFVRIDANWAVIEATQGTYNWTNLDTVVNAIVAKGLEPMLIATYAPGWASSGGGSHPPPTSTGPFTAFCTALAGRYQDRVTVFEIWNEPNLDMFWTAPNVANYTTLLKAAYPAIKAVNPALYVITGGLSPASDGTNIAPITFCNGIYSNGGQGYFDGFGMHPYCFPTLPNDSNIAWSCFKQQWTVHDIMVSHGDGAKLVWNTESGAPSPYGDGAVNEATQAETIRQVFQAGLDNAWMGPQLVYTMRDPGVSTTDREMNFGVVKQDFTPKAAYTTVGLFGT